MANSFVSTIATAGQTTFPFNFPNGYLSEDHIKVFVDGVDTTRTISSGSAIIAACQGGEEVVVARQSPQTPYISFEDGSILNKQNIDTQNRHAFMLAEEAAEQRDFFALGDIDMNYHKIIHVAPGSDQYDVVNKGQFDYFLEATHDDRIAAESAAAAAADSSAAAAGSAGSASTDALRAEAAANEAEAILATIPAEGDIQVARVIAEGDTQDARVTAEGDYQYGRAKDEADRALVYAETLERPFEDMGGHTIQQGYPPVPPFSSMWYILDGGVDPGNPNIIWNVGDYLVYSTQTSSFSRLTGESVQPGPAQPIEILDDLIMQQGKVIRFKTGETTDTVALTVDVDGDVVVGEIPATPSTQVPNAKAGITARDAAYVITATDAGGLAVKERIMTSKYAVSEVAQNTAAGAFTRKDYVEATFGAKAANNTWTGQQTFNANTPESIKLLGEGTNSENRLAAYTADGLTRKWYIGHGNSDADTVYFRNDQGGAVLALRHGGEIDVNKSFTVDTGDITKAQILAGGTAGIMMRDAAGINKWFSYYEPSANQYRVTRYDVAGTFLDSPVIIDSAGAVMLRTPKAQTTQGNTADALTRKDYVDTFRKGYTGSGISISTDWNTLTTAGTYYLGYEGNTFGPNGPADSGYSYGILVVEYANNVWVQTYYPHSPTGKVSERVLFGSGWSPWRYAFDTAHTPAKQAAHGNGTTSSFGFTRPIGCNMLTVVLTVGGKNFPLTVPIINTGSYWISRWGGESADRDYSFGVTVQADANTITLVAQKGQYAASNPAINQIFTW